MSAAYYPQVQKIYVAYYGRPADPAGLQYWAGRLAATNGNLSAIIDAFGNSAESTALYAGADNAAKVTAIYQQLFNRAPETAGLNFYVGELAAGRMTAASIALNVANGAQGTDLTYLNNKTTVATAFSDQLTTDAAAAVAYSGTTATTAARSLISGVTTSAATTNVASTITSIKTGSVTAAAGQTFTLTTGTNTFTGTSGNDTFSAPQGTLATADVLVDTSSSDSDVLNATVTTASLATRIQYVETLNVNGAYATTGFDLGNVTGTNKLNLSTALGSGTATVTNANTLNAKNINIGSNVSTVNVTSSGAGTRDTVGVDLGSALTATITGSTGGVDSYQIKAGSGSTVTLATVGSADDVEIQAAGTLALTGVAALGDLTLRASGDLTVTATTATADNTIVEGSGNVTIRGAKAIFDGLSLANNNAGTVTFRQTDATATADYDEVIADVVELTVAAAATATVSVNEATTVNLEEDVTFAGNITLDVDNADGNLAADAGTLLLNVSESQDVAASKIITGVGVGTLVIQATPDEASDTASGARITVVELDTSANGTGTIVARGTGELEIDLLTNAASTIISATEMSAKLKIDATAATATMYLGSGNDDISAGAFATTIYGNGGNDTLDGGNAGMTIFGGDGNDVIGGGSGTASRLQGDAGNDTITGGSAADTISGGVGDDLIIGGGGSDTITAGSGVDTIRMGAQTGVVISDFVIGEDLLVLTGTSTINSAFDLASVTPSSGLYSFSSTHTVTLTGNTGTDLSNTVTLGRAGAAFVVLAGANLSSGGGNDVIEMNATDGTSSTIIGGGGNDTITLTTAATLATGGVTITGGTGDDTITLTSREGEAVLVNVGSGADNLVLGSTSTGVATIQWGSNGHNAVQTIVQFDTTEDKLSFDGIVAGLTATSGTAITAGTTAAGALTDDRVYVITSGATAVGGETIVNYTDLNDVAAFLAAQHTSTASGDVAVYVINDTIGLKSYVYLFQESASAASTISSSELKLIGVVTEETGGALVAGDIA